MIKIGVVDEMDRLQGRFRNQMKQHRSVAIGTAGAFGNNYLFAFHVRVVIAAIESLCEVPCDVTISLDMVPGKKPVFAGSITLYSPQWQNIAELAVRSAENAMAAAAVLTFREVHFTFTQTCDHGG